MNQTNCPPGIATDLVFKAATPGVTCDASLTAYVVILTIFTLGTSARHKEAVRIPFVPVFSLLGAISYLILLTCTTSSSSAATQMGSFNGSALAIVAMGFLAQAITASLFLVKFMKLSRKLISLGSLTSSPTSNGTTTGTKKVDLEYLSQLNTVGIVFFGFIVIFIMASTVIFCIALPLDPQNFKLIQAGFAADAMFDLFLGIIFVWHVQRLMNAVNATWINTDGASEWKKRALLGRFRIQQKIMLAFCMCGSLVYLLIVAGVYPPTWYVILILMSFDVISQLTMAIIATRHVKKKIPHDAGDKMQVEAKKPSDQQVTPNNNNNNNT